MNLVVIGMARTSFLEQPGTPIAPVFAEGEPATLEILPEYRMGLADLEGFQRIWVLSWLHQAEGYELKPVPYRDTVRRGLFATRAPRRPNPIGLSCVEVESVDAERGVITVNGIDLLDGTPIIDIKPYVAQVDAFPGSRGGWFDGSCDVRTADARFAGGGADAQSKR